MSETAAPGHPDLLLPGPFGTLTRPFSVLNRHGDVIRGMVHTPPERKPARVVLAVGGFAMTTRQTLAPALHLLSAGFTVVRFDPTNSHGLSDGGIVDFNPTRLLHDLCDVGDWARHTLHSRRIGILAFSISGRVGIRAAHLRSDLFAVVGTITGAVHLADSLRRILTTGGLPPDGAEGNGSGGLADAPAILGQTVRSGLLSSAAQDDWLARETTYHEMSGTRSTRFLNVHGRDDPLIDLADVQAVYGAAPNGDFRVLPGTDHHLSLAQQGQAVAHLIEEYRRSLTPRDVGGRPPVTDADLLAQKRIDRRITAWWAGLVGHYRMSESVMHRPTALARTDNPEHEGRRLR